MQLLALLLCLMVGGSVAFIGERCDYSKCKDSNPFEDLGKVRFMPNAQQLRDYCPKMVSFLECNIDVIESCVGQTISELAASSNQSVAGATDTLLEIGSLVRDVCNPHSTLHKDYVANIECFKGFVIVGTKLCQLEGKETLADFYEKSSIEKGGLDDTLNSEIRCLELAYEVACTTIRLGESCGESARSALVTVVRRLRGTLTDMQCKGGIHNLKEKFMHYTEVDDEQMSKIKEVFDLFRRRR